MPAPTVTLDAATPADAALLGNLLELYVHDMSGIFDVALGADGRFGYPALPLYWAEPERRFAFLIRLDGQVAGFVLATRGSPQGDDRAVHDVAEFFVLRRHRRTGVGRQAASLLWRRLPGRWTVRVLTTNRGALAFWQHAVDDVAGGRATVETRPGRPAPWLVHAFDTAPDRRDASAGA